MKLFCLSLSDKYWYLHNDTCIYLCIHVCTYIIILRRIKRYRAASRDFHSNLFNSLQSLLQDRFLSLLEISYNDIGNYDISFCANNFFTNGMGNLEAFIQTKFCLAILYAIHSLSLSLSHTDRTSGDRRTNTSHNICESNKRLRELGPNSCTAAITVVNQIGNLFLLRISLKNLLHVL